MFFLGGGWFEILTALDLRGIVKFQFGRWSCGLIHTGPFLEESGTLGLGLADGYRILCSPMAKRVLATCILIEIFVPRNPICPSSSKISEPTNFTMTGSRSKIIYCLSSCKQNYFCWNCKWFSIKKIIAPILSLKLKS